LLNDLAHEFTERVRRGESPTVEQYAQAYPDQADEIRELFPMLLLMERFDPNSPSAREEGSDPLPTPQRLGEYRILRRLGRGGMGVVYEAVQESLGRHVALKVLPVHSASDSRLLERFKREARAAANLHHTNIVPVFGVGEDQGVYYYAMQFIAGDSLDRLFSQNNHASRTHAGRTELTRDSNSFTSQTPNLDRDEPLTVAPTDDSGPPILIRPDDFLAIARIGGQVADALVYAHAHGVLHRDIKPANILLDEQGTAWVSDFGLAKIEGLNELTMADDVLGTLQYVPPERFQGQTDARGDIYSLGLTLYQLLTGQAAFAATTRAELVRRVLQDQPPAPRSVNRHVPRDLETIVLKAIAKDPDERYQTAAELAEDLQRFQADRPILARRLSVAERWGRWWRKNPLLAISELTAALLLVAVAVVSTLAYLREKSLGDSLQAALSRAQEAETQGRNELFGSYVSSAKAARLSRRQGQRYDSLAAIQKAAELLPQLGLPAEEQQQRRDELRDLAVTCLALPDVRGVGHLAKGQTLDLYHLNRSVKRDADGTLVVMQWPDGGEVARLPGVSDDTQFWFSAESDELLLLDAQTDVLFRWRINELRPQKVAQLQKHDGTPDYYEFSRANDRLAVVHQGDSQGLLEVLAWPSGDLVLAQKLPKCIGIRAARMSLDGHFVAVIQGSYGQPGSRLVRVYDVDTAVEVATLEHRDSVASAAWHPDSETLAVGLTNTNDIVLWNVAKKRQLATLTNQRGGEPHLWMSDTGQLLVSLSSWTNIVDFWHPYTQTPVLHFPHFYHFHWNTTDGRLVGTHYPRDGGCDIMVADPSPVMKTLARNPVHGDVAAWRFVSVHPDGRLLAVGSDDGVTLFDLDSGLEAAHLPVGNSLCALFVPETGDLLTYSEQGLIRWESRSDSRSVSPRPTPTAPPSAQPSSDQPETASGTPARPSGEEDLAGVVRQREIEVRTADGESRSDRNLIGPRRPVEIEVRTADGESRRYSPTKLPCPWGTGRQVASDRTGKVIAAAAGKSAVVLHNYGERIVKLGPLPDCRGVAVSPDGRWVVTTNHDAGPVDVWDAESGVLIHRVVESLARTNVCFSPDGQWLSLHSSSPSRLRTGTWQQAPVDDSGQPGFYCYSPDGRLALRLDVSGAILCEAATGRKLATLSTPDTPAVWYATFAPDSRRVVLNCNERHETYVWDLAQLSRELSALGLSWDAAGGMERSQSK